MNPLLAQMLWANGNQRAMNGGGGGFGGGPVQGGFNQFGPTWDNSAGYTAKANMYNSDNQAKANMYNSDNQLEAALAQMQATLGMPKQNWKYGGKQTIDSQMKLPRIQADALWDKGGRQTLDLQEMLGNRMYDNQAKSISNRFALGQQGLALAKPFADRAALGRNYTVTHNTATPNTATA